MSYPIYRYQAFKPYEQGLVACDKDDVEATEFHITYTPIDCNFYSTLQVDKKHIAESIVSAMHSAHKQGKQDAFAELRRLIGAKP